MKKTSRKNLKPARSRTDHAAGCRLNNAEMAQARADLSEVAKLSPVPVKLGAYVKKAILDYGRLRRMEAAMRDAVTSFGLADTKDTHTEHTHALFDRMKAILEGA